MLAILRDALVVDALAHVTWLNSEGKCECALGAFGTTRELSSK